MRSDRRATQYLHQRWRRDFVREHAEALLREGIAVIVLSAGALCDDVVRGALERAAQASGARIVHTCGFDSIPSDLGVHFLQQQSMKRFGQPCTQVKMRVKAMRGGFSGGTVASLLNVVKEASARSE